jgi:alanine-glyoxylate transaminase/serine-glyoxylate transaminase/serine-pyruvate transaminase
LCDQLHARSAAPAFLVGAVVVLLAARLRLARRPWITDPVADLLRFLRTTRGASTSFRSGISLMARSGLPALLTVDTISGLAPADYRHDAWGVDVTASGSHKGLMLPPGISFNAVSEKAIEQSRSARLPKAFWAWDEIIEMNRTGYWPHTPNTKLLYALSESIAMIEAEGLPQVFARHQRLAAACRAAVQGWRLQIQCADPAVYSPVLTGVLLPSGVDADQVRQLIYQRFDMSLGAGLGKVKGRMFRIGHLGECNDLTLLAAIGGCAARPESPSRARARHSRGRDSHQRPSKRPCRKAMKVWTF